MFHRMSPERCPMIDSNAVAPGRRRFLARVSAIGAAVGLTRFGGPGAATALAAVPHDDAHFPAPDDAWTTRLTGRHKQFVDATSPNDGWPLAFALSFRNAFNGAYGVPDAQLTSVVGLRHFAMPLGLTDDLWAKYHIGEGLKIMDPVTKAPAVRNPYYTPQAGALMFPDAAIDKLQARGTMFTVCNLALTALSGMLGQGIGVSADDAKKEWTAGLLPGMIIVPSGTLALTRAQEKGCAYCYGG